MDLASGFLIGVLGSFHCAAMCGPIALVLPSGSSRGATFYLGRILYNGGRVVTYALLGVTLGYLGKSIMLAGLQRSVSILIGCVIALAVFVPSMVKSVLARCSPLNRLHSILKVQFAGLLHRRSQLSLFLIGMLNGFLPCGFVYVALAGAVTLGEGLRGMMFLVGFGLGTMPVMLTISFLGRKISSALRTRVAILAPVLTLAIAVLFILRGLNLGIPYISPSITTEGVKVEAGACH